MPTLSTSIKLANRGMKALMGEVVGMRGRCFRTNLRQVLSGGVIML